MNNTSTQPEIGMKLDAFMSGQLKIVSDSPLRQAQIGNALKNNGLNVEAPPTSLSNNFANMAAPEQVAPRAAAVPAPALNLNIGLAQG